MFVLLLSLLAGVHNDSSLAFEPCFTEKCFRTFGEKFKITLSLIQLITQFFLGILTAFGVVLAIFSYFNSKESSNFNIHIANMAFFGNSLENLVSQREYISYNSVNKNVLYNLIFPNSKKGNVADFERYSSELVRFRSYLIGKSNSFRTQASSSDINSRDFFTSHRESVIGLASIFGVTISPVSKVDFYNIEDDLIILIDSITDMYTNLNFTRYKLSSVNRYYR